MELNKKTLAVEWDSISATWGPLPLTAGSRAGGLHPEVLLASDSNRTILDTSDTACMHKVPTGRHFTKGLLGREESGPNLWVTFVLWAPSP